MSSKAEEVTSKCCIQVIKHYNQTNSKMAGFTVGMAGRLGKRFVVYAERHLATGEET